jgi:hypothetical protein
MKPRGSCPDCQLRDAQCVVHDPERDGVRLCLHCASVYDAKLVERFDPRIS